uniref:Uncharacterized protein n=1 Tax=Aegilops tauschii subsp. strangulata TaxID=200361 RepID=A0A453FW34_AEGTS
MNWRSEHIWVELLKGSRKRGNFFWACILFLGSLGFLSVGISSYLGKNIISILPRSKIRTFALLFFFGHIWHGARTLFRDVFAGIDPDLDAQVEFGTLPKLLL